MRPTASKQLLLTLLVALSTARCTFARSLATNAKKSTNATNATGPTGTSYGVSTKSVKSIQMVTTTLQDILSSATAEEQKEEDLHKAAQTERSTRVNTLNNSISTTASELQTAQLAQSTKTAELQSLTKSIKDNKAQVEQVKDTMDQAGTIRTQEKDKYDDEMQLNTQSITQVTKAIEHVQKVQQTGGFLQNGVVQRLQLNEPGESGYVLGVMKGILMKLQKTKKELEEAETQKAKDHEALVKSNQDELGSLQAALIQDQQTLTQTKIDKNQATRDVDKYDTELQRLTAQLRKTKAEYAQAELNYKATSTDRAKEKAALTEAVRYLQTELKETLAANVSLLVDTDEGDEDDSGPVALASSEGLATSGDAQEDSEDMPDDSDTAGQSAPTFLQARSRNAAISRSTRGSLGMLSDAADAEFLGLGTGLDALQQKETFDSVSKVVKGLIKANRASQKQETDKLNYCKAGLQGKDIEQEDSQQKIRSLTASKEQKEAKVRTADSEVAAIEKQIQDMNNEEKAAKKARKEQKAAYEAQTKDRTLAAKVLEQAKKVLTDFYDEKSEAGKGRKEIRSSAAIDLLAQISRDVSQEQVDAAKEESQAETDFEQYVIDNRDTFDRKMKEVTGHKVLKGKLTVQINALEEDLASENDALKNIKTQLTSLHTECDELIANFEERKKARMFEVEQLRDVQDILAGSSIAVRTGA